MTSRITTNLGRAIRQPGRAKPEQIRGQPVLAKRLSQHNEVLQRNLGR